jgi:hypothetical protein
MEPAGEGVAIARVDFSNCLDDAKDANQSLRQLQAVTLPQGQPVEIQFIPDPTPAADSSSSALSPRGLMLLSVPPDSTGSYRLSFDGRPSPSTADFDGMVVRKGYVTEHRAATAGGLPRRFRFPLSGKEFTEFTWNDRVHDEQAGGYWLRNDPQAEVQLISEGPICSVVRARAAYKRSDGTQPDSRPRAVYDWYYFHDVPLVFVTANIAQDEPFRWREVHFLELNFPKADFARWAGGEPEQQAELKGDSQSHRSADWAGVLDGENGIGMFGCGAVLVHDGRGSYGTYLHADGDRAWQPWEDRQRSHAAWLWVGTDKSPAATMRSLQRQLPRQVEAVVSPERIHRAITAARQAAESARGDARAQQLRQVAWAARLEAGGRFSEALAALAGTLPADWRTLAAGELQLTLQQVSGGAVLRSLFDTAANHEHLPASPAPLFRITLQHMDSGKLATLLADEGWRQVSLTSPDASQLEIQWKQPAAGDLGDFSVVARAVASPAQHAIHWTLATAGQPAPWSVTHVVFPQLELAAPGSDPVVLFPRGPGEVQPGVWQRTFSYGGLYPSGWTAMQFLAAYDRTTSRGLYWALHDPLGSTKNLSCASDPARTTLMWSADHPVPNMRQAGNRFELSGTAVWQAFTGDWFDAARIYREWVRREARWFPALLPQGREDTPSWLRDLCAWAQTGGPASGCVEPVLKFQEFLGVPTGFHWYSWHAIPFDNDYPHYFPTTAGFAEGVARLQQSQVYVMPYINGRLWDTRDRGIEDFEFTQRARAAATKNEQGEPVTEVYGSKESDGSSVRLAVMCPATEVWQQQVNAIVSRLLGEYQVAGVYIDQIAAASPVLCFDPQHGHPLGGGSWWNSAYWQMLERIRQGKPPQSMLTSECNAEPFLRWFDGYLTWHWQYDGQVPAFPAIYGGAIQMFGRAYRGGATKDLALRMKAGQQLVFGEQIGWLDPRVTQETENAAFLRDVIRLRWQLRRYFSAGEMLRPPRLRGKLPTVRADWQWQDNWWVTTDAVLTGAWHLPQDQRVVALFVNVSDEEVEADWSFDAATTGISTPRVQVTEVTQAGAGRSGTESREFSRKFKIAPRSAVALEIAPSAER